MLPPSGALWSGRQLSAATRRMGLRAAVAAVTAGVIWTAAAGAGSGAAGRCGDPAVRPWCDRSLPAGKRADLLLNAMTRDEKISLLAGEQLPDVGRVGGANQHSAASLGIPRLGVPRLNFVNGPAGLRQGPATAFPAPLAQAATWKPELANESGAVTADEATKKDNDFLYAPTVNIMRTPVNGRTFEGYGEDPFLDSRMTVEWIKGAQDHGAIAVVKHFAANNQEGYGGAEANTASPRTAREWIAGKHELAGDRKRVDVNVDQRTLHEIYYPHFEAAIKEADVGAVMCAHNKVNGIHACRNRTLLTSVLRNEWGFKGIVLSDHTAAGNTAGSLRSGLDFEPFPGTIYGPPAVNAALDGGHVTMRNVRLHVFRILRTMFAYGVFDRPGYVNDPSRIDVTAHAQVAKRIEQSAMTLLRNKRSILPLRAGRLRSIAVVGPGATQYAFGGGSSRVRPFFKRTPLGAITRLVPDTTEVRYDDGSSPTTAATVARGADVAVVFVRDYLTEGVDRSCLTLECPADFGDQDALIQAVAAANPHTVVVLETGGPVLTPWRNDVDGLLEAWYPGEAGGPAIARVLFGKSEPGGRLPATFPRRAGDIPTAGGPKLYPGINDEVYYKEGVFVGYRWYDEHDLRPAFPFGFGLSYTTFRYRHLRVTPSPSGRSTVARARLDVSNTGNREGRAVPQLYLSLPSRRGLPEPPKELKGFDTVSLKPGKTKTVTIPLRNRDFAHWATGAKDWKVSPGCYRVRVGASSRDLPLEATVARGGARCGRDAVSILAG
jgi:beta-glucosidase